MKSFRFLFGSVFLVAAFVTTTPALAQEADSIAARDTMEVGAENVGDDSRRKQQDFQDSGWGLLVMVLAGGAGGALGGWIGYEDAPREDQERQAVIGFSIGAGIGAIAWLIHRELREDKEREKHPSGIEEL